MNEKEEGFLHSLEGPEIQDKPRWISDPSIGEAGCNGLYLGHPRKQEEKMKRFTSLLTFAVLLATSGMASAQTMLNQSLDVRQLVKGLNTPTGMAFLGKNDMLVIEKNTGMVQRVVNGTVRGSVLDLPVNFASERGLLGIALHPGFPANPRVYLYWTESSGQGDTDVLSQTPRLGNRVGRFVWDGSSLVFERDIIRLRALQSSFLLPNGAKEREGGNHDGGKIAFGPDGKLYVLVGDLGRRGQMQNLSSGPFGAGSTDDEFGGPQPDDAHLTGCILRLDDDGSAPTDNPFFAAGASMTGEAGANIQRIFAYGIRNSFGMAFDPVTGDLWESENGDDSFDEINRIVPGMNGGWIQTMGPIERIADFKSIEIASGDLQQKRWPPEKIADTPEQALSRLFVLPGSKFVDPEFSWKFTVSPTAMGFMNSESLGAEFKGGLFVGAGQEETAGGYLFHFKFTPDRKRIAVDGPGLEDRVADNSKKNDITQSETLLVGKDFGIVTDIQAGPNGNLFVVSLTKGAIFEVFRK
jgi:glucose/arabinose dehydrogenase